ncbi:MAG: efflux RND transporter periplasmic adaptor subunit, partial [Burkholderiales bacterium]|nr:efflux RND transporter periplasmic adaptor subunit [Burkholderiales bacterium]
VQAQRQVQQRNLDAAEATLARTRAELALARSRTGRDRGLAAQGFLSEAALDASRSAAEAAEAAERAALAAREARRAELDASAQELRAAEAAQSYTRLAAPMAGIVVQRRAEPGATVVPGSPLLDIVDPASVWVAMRVDEAMLGRVALGQPARIRLRSGVEAAGRVARIARQSDASTREVDVHVAFDAVPPSFVIDAEAEVRVDTGRARGLVVPPAALLRDRDGRSGVLRVEDGRAHFVPARPGAADAGRQLVEPEAAGALRAGDRVVAPTTGVRDGMRVRDAG